MTHNTREVEEWEQEFDKKFPQFLEFEGALHPNLADASDIRFKLKAFIHHQLQKAREEERERAIEIMKDELRTAPLEVQMTKGIVFANIIKRIQAELDQDKK